MGKTVLGVCRRNRNKALMAKECIQAQMNWIWKGCLVFELVLIFLLEPAKKLTLSDLVQDGMACIQDCLFS